MMTATTVLTFVCGFAAGTASALILMILAHAHARRRRHYGVPSPYNQMAQGTMRPPTDEPTELDQ